MEYPALTPPEKEKFADLVRAGLPKEEDLQYRILANMTQPEIDCLVRVNEDSSDKTQILEKLLQLDEITPDTIRNTVYNHFGKEVPSSIKNPVVGFFNKAYMEAEAWTVNWASEDAVRKNKRRQRNNNPETRLKDIFRQKVHQRIQESITAYKNKDFNAVLKKGVADIAGRAAKIIQRSHKGPLTKESIKETIDNILTPHFLASTEGQQTREVLMDALDATIAEEKAWGSLNGENTIAHTGSSSKTEHKPVIY